ncbi:MAG TPA: lamin tail domain-containing protein [Pyrinomonadaceae bacterium]|jgi:subtilisin-like proprotein convertase family protein|nr:lamin tail domain-containing protein [Pyrinomonadaceae bacterium]
MRTPVRYKPSAFASILFSFLLLASQTAILGQQRGTPTTSGVQSGPISDPQPDPGDIGTAAVTGTSVAGATISGGAATPYPILVPIAGLTGNVSKVTVTINDLTHTAVRDVDILLVAPTDDTRNLTILSDIGGGAASVSNIDLTLDDAAATNLPGGGTPVTGTFKPTDCDGNTGGACEGTGAEDAFPAPAPAVTNEPAGAGTATFASVFNGMTAAEANGNWRVYIVDDSVGVEGGTVGQISITIQEAAVPLSAGSLIISEYRTRGSGGAGDEFVELYNTTANPIIVAATDGSAGFSVASSTGIRCTIPNLTNIPAGGHFLCTGTAYSLASYAASNAPMATGLNDALGIALFNTANTANYSTTTRLDAVGPTSEANTLYREGAGVAAIATPPSTQYTFYRDLCNLGANNRCTAATGSAGNYGGGAGKPKDTGDNAADFLFADVVPTSTTAGQRLGAPGPENLASPIQRNAGTQEFLIDATVASSLAPNRVRNSTPSPGSTTQPLGTLSIRRRYVNNTGAPITSLRFRITNITTAPTPAAATGIADVRAITTPADVVITGVMDPATCASIGTPGTPQCSVTVKATTLENAAEQPNGGGFNSSWSVAIPGGSLANGGSIGVNFTLGVVQLGTFRLLLNVEALP